MNKTRLSSTEKLVIAKSLAEKAKSLIAEFGKPEKLGGKNSPQVAKLNIGEFTIFMLTPFSGVKIGHGDFQYQVDVFHKQFGKVFGAVWSPKKKWANEFECFRLVKGQWVNEFFTLHSVGA